MGSTPPLLNQKPLPKTTMSSVISPAWTTPAHLLPNRQKNQADAPIEEPVNINSPLLFEMLNRLSFENRTLLLDISQASTSGLDYFKDYWCKIFFTNSITEISKTDPSLINTPHKWHRTLVKTMGFYKNDKTGLDMILLWGLPNYLTTDQLKGLINYLLPQCSKNAFLHTYIFNSELMSEVQANYRIQNKNKVAIQPQQISDEITCPMYHLNDLQKCFAPFTLDHSVMLSSGIQEYVFKLT